MSDFTGLGDLVDQVKQASASIAQSDAARGGRTVWHYWTHNPNLKGGVAFYGDVISKNDAAPKTPIELAPEVKEPVLGLYGEADTIMPPHQVKQMEG